ncbi:hypothetical protein L1D40_05890 [Shewanella insulae]|uniref:hypothetical protein n=1 Tax=Shewanella insulae TaxID=2681496 RepID=UPI001EFCE81E|nr:hypothetical protein [Shewanella insulae]MCG9754764.1 hypothetical protein [Shewanella insulae]
MNSFDHLLENLKWFDTVFLSQYLGLDKQSTKKLPISFNFFALPLKKECLLATSLLPFILLALFIPSVDPRFDFLRFPILTIMGLLVYAIIRKRQVKAHLGIEADSQANQQIIISQSGITLPPFLTSKSGTPQSIGREDIVQLQFDWHSYQNSNQIECKRAHRLVIKLKRGESYSLSSMAYPLRSLLYLAIFFDYPIVMEESTPPKERLGSFLLALGASVLLLNLWMIFISP